MTNEMKPREFWIKAIGFQDDREIRISLNGGSELYGHIDLTNSCEDRWINTLVQTVNPGTNPISMRTKWLHVIEKSHYDLIMADVKELIEALEDDSAYTGIVQYKALQKWNDKYTNKEEK